MLLTQAEMSSAKDWPRADSFPPPFSFRRRGGEGSFSKNGSVVFRARLGNRLFEQESEIWQKAERSP